MNSLQRILLLIVVYVLALTTSLLLAPTATSQAETQADLGIEQLSPGEPTVAAEDNVIATVKNHGPDPALGFTVTFYWNNQGQYLTGNASDSEANRSATVLEPGETATVELPWTPTENQAGNGHVLAVVDTSQGTQDPDGDNDEGTQATFVALPGVDVTSSWSTDTISIEVGTTRDFGFNVENTGNVAANYTPHVTPPDAPETQNWTFEATPSQAHILPGEEVAFALTVAVPENATAGTQASPEDGFALAIHEEGYTDSDLGVANPTPPTLETASQRGLNVTADPPDAGLPGETLAGGSVRVANEGNTNETIDLNVSASQSTIPSDWTVAYIPSTVKLDAFEASHDPQVEIQLPDDATAGTYDLVTLAAAREGTLPPVAHDTTPVHVKQIHRIEVNASTPSLNLLPDQSATIPIEVNNTGNGNDSITVTSDLPEGWTLTPQPENLTLAPNASGTLHARVQAPATIPPQDSVPATMTLTTQGGDRADNTTVQADITVLEGPNLHLGSVPDTVTLEPEGQTIPLPVVNGGNQAGNLTLTPHAPEGWEATLNQHQVDHLSPGLTERLELTVTPPESAVTGDQAAITLDASGDTASSSSTSPSLSFTVGGPDLAVSFTQAPTRVPEGHHAPIHVKVANSGLEPTPETSLVLATQGPGGSERIETWTVPRLDPGRILEYNTTWNSTDERGSTLFTLQADPDRDVREEDETNNEATSEAFVAVTRVGIQPPPPRTVTPGQHVQIGTGPTGLALTNEGNVELAVTVEIHDDHGWLNESLTRRIAAQATEKVALEFDVPRPTHGVENNLTIDVRSDPPSNPPSDPSSPDGDRPNAASTWTATWTLGVRDVAPPRALALNATPQPRWGEPTTLTVDWADGTGPKTGIARLTPENGTTTERSLNVTEDHEIQLDWTPQASGPHRVEVALEDQAGNRAPARVFEIDVAPPRPPTIGINASVRTAPGSLVPLDLDAPAPLSSVRALVEGSASQLEEPYRLNTTGWTEGNRTVELQATDVTGQTAHATTNVTIDATPPEIVDATVEPTDPEPGQQVRVELGFSEPVQRVTLTLVADDGTRQTQATRVDNATRAHLAFTASTSIERIDVQATDEAGTTGFTQAGVPLDDGLLSTPAPGAFAIGIAAATAAGLTALRRDRADGSG